MKKFGCILICIIFILLISGGCSADENITDVENGTIAVMKDSVYSKIAEKYYPDAEIDYYNTVSETVSAVKNGNADALLTEDVCLEHMFASNPELEIYGEDLEKLDCCFVFLKGYNDEIRSNLDSFITKLSESGELAEIITTYSSSDTENAIPPEITSDGSGGSFYAVDTSDRFPFCYIQNGEMTGIDVAILNLFSNEYNYDITIEDYDSGTLFETISKGGCDFAGSGLNYTEERAEKYYFSVPYLSTGVITVIGTKTGEKTTLLQSVSDSFYNNFIKESRWKLLLQGVGTTIIITMLSAVIGTFAGYFLYILYYQNKKAGLILKAASYIVHGLPVVVLIMILYYIILPPQNFSGTAVSVIGFSLVHAFSVFDMIKDGVDAVDRGQIEAAYTLGYNPRKTFTKWILPQAAANMLPSYKSGMTALIQSTSVVGYIAVTDLTKAGDIIRSLTYESFFPLIVVAVIYFVLGILLMFITGKIANLFNPVKRKRDRFLKGVNTK